MDLLGWITVTVPSDNIFCLEIQNATSTVRGCQRSGGEPDKTDRRPAQKLHGDIHNEGETPDGIFAELTWIRSFLPIELTGDRKQANPRTG